MPNLWDLYPAATTDTGEEWWKKATEPVTPPSEPAPAAEERKKPDALDLFLYHTTVKTNDALQGLLRMTQAGTKGIPTGDPHDALQGVIEGLKEQKAKMGEYWGVTPEDEKTTTSKITSAAANVADIIPGAGPMLVKMAGETYANAFDQSVQQQADSGKTPAEIEAQANKDAALGVVKLAPQLAIYAAGGKVASLFGGALPANAPAALRALVGGAASAAANLGVSGTLRAAQGGQFVGDTEQNLTDIFFGVPSAFHAAFVERPARPVAEPRVVAPEVPLPTAPPAEAPSEAAPPPAEAAPPPAVEPPESQPVAGEVRRVLTSEMALKPDLMQFKEADNEAQGTNANDTITAPYDPIKAGNLLLWEPNDPAKYGLAPGQKYIVANGHHRHAKALADEIETQNAQILRESAGYSAGDARAIAAEANIADGKGTIYDAARFIRETAASRGENVALDRARQIGARGRKATAIALDAGPDLYTAFINERISPEVAATIADSAPKDESLQRLGIQQALKGKDTLAISNFLEAVKASTGPTATAEQTDLFGADDAAIQQAEAAAERAAKLQKELSEQINAVRGAAKRPEKAAALGVDIKDPEAVRAKLGELQSLAARAKNWSGDSEVRDLVLHGDMQPGDMIDRLLTKAPDEAAGLGVAAMPAPEALRQQYNREPEARGGTVLNVDVARELFPIYRADRSRSAEVHEAASTFIRELYAKRLSEPTPPGKTREVLFTAGGTGAGKTTGEAMLSPKSNAEIIYDTNLGNFESSRAKIDQALSAGRAVKILYTHREAVDALVNGVFKRARRMERELGSGRTVPLSIHEETHVSARKTIERLVDQYGADPRVTFSFVDNSRGKGNARVTTLDKLPAVEEAGLSERLNNALETARAKGDISEAIYRGSKAEVLPPGYGVGPESGRGLEPGGATGHNAPLLEPPGPPKEDLLFSPKRRRGAPEQFELPGAEQAFNLQGETGIDWEARTREAEQAASEAAAARVKQDQEQQLLFQTQKETLPRRITPIDPATTDIVSEADIRKYLARALDIPVRAGLKAPGGGLRALGYYRVKPETIRMGLMNDLPTLAHELGHYVHHLLFNLGTTTRPSDFGKQFDPELMALGQRTSLPSYTPKQVRMEGVAEFMRNWLTDRSKAFAAAPNFTTFFEGELKSKYPLSWRILERGREMVAQYINQPAMVKVRSKIVFDPQQPRKTFREWMQRKYTDWFNELAPIERSMKQVAAFGASPAQAQRVSDLTINYKGGWRGKADYDLEYNQTDLNAKEIGPGLKEILKGIDPKTEMKDLSSYWALMRAREKKAQGVTTGFEEDLRDPEVQTWMKANAPRYEPIRQKLLTFSDNNVKLMLDAGLISREGYVKMRELNKDYAPFYRIYESVGGSYAIGASGGGGFVNTGRGIFRMKGDNRQILDPMEGLIKNVYMFRDLAERNRVGREFVDIVSKTLGAGRIGETIATPVKPIRISHDEVWQQVSPALKQQGLDAKEVFGENADLALTIFRATTGVKPEEGIFRVWKDGKEQNFQVADQDLLRALSLADTVDANVARLWPLFRPFRHVTKMLRTGATLSLEFMARNLFRDQVSAAVFSKHGFIPFFDGFRGVFSVLGKDKLYRDWVKGGGRYSSLYDIESANTAEALARVVRDPAMLAQAQEWVRHPLRTLSQMGTVLEEASRVSEYRRALANGATPLEAANASKDVTINFSRYGLKGKILNQMIAFFNAGLQDVDKIVRSHRERPGATIAKGLFYITAPSVLTWLAGKDDKDIQNLPEWRKQLFWNVHLGDHVWSLPKPFLLGALYGTSVEKGLDYVSGRDPNALKKFLGALRITGPIQSDIITSSNAFKPVLENMTNYSFFTGRPLVSQAQAGLSPEMQYTPNTSETAKFVGGRVGYSPVYVDNLIRGYLGGLGRYGTDAVDWFLLKAQGNDTPRPAKGITQYPPLRGFTPSPYEQSAFVDRFYNGLQTAETRLNDMRAYGFRLQGKEMRDFLLKNRNELVWYNAGLNGSEDTPMTELRRVRNSLADINKAMTAVQAAKNINAEDKQRDLVKLGQLRDKLAEGAFNRYLHPTDREKVF